MIIKQIYTNCLSEASYIISSGNEAVLIDPLREPFKYINYAKKNNLKIKYILETHFHADFVSGHLELSKLTKSKIIFGNTIFPINLLHAISIYVSEAIIGTFIDGNE